MLAHVEAEEPRVRRARLSAKFQRGTGEGTIAGVGLGRAAETSS